MHICIIYYVLVSKEYRNEYKLVFIINNVIVYRAICIQAVPDCEFVGPWLQIL
jgi:hypothetical protein